MKWMLLFFLLIFMNGTTAGQDAAKGDGSFGQNSVNTAQSEVGELLTSRPNYNFNSKPDKNYTPTFRVRFHNFPNEAKIAFNHAVSIWEKYIYSPVPIIIEARWEELGGNILAKGNPSIFYNNFSGAPIADVYYPVALAEKLAGRDLNSGAPDIICRFSSKYNWYFGLDGKTPSTHYDLISSALHEITHGLGFSGFLNERDGIGFYNNNHELPSIYDYLLFNDKNEQISDRSRFQSRSRELLEQITSDNIMFCRSALIDQQQKMIDWIFAPPVWNDGTSIYHLKGYEYGQENSLMAPFAIKGKSVHEPGNVTLSILAELGWYDISFEFNPLKDIQKAVDEWPVQVKLNSNNEAVKDVKVVYTFEGSPVANHVVLNKSEAFDNFIGQLNLSFKTGRLKYYLEATTYDNRSYRLPANAPANYFSMNVGPDNFVPDLYYNPIALGAHDIREPIYTDLFAADHTTTNLNQLPVISQNVLHSYSVSTGPRGILFSFDIVQKESAKIATEKDAEINGLKDAANLNALLNFPGKAFHTKSIHDHINMSSLHHYIAVHNNMNLSNSAGFQNHDIAVFQNQYLIGKPLKVSGQCIDHSAIIKIPNETDDLYAQGHTSHILTA